MLRFRKTSINYFNKKTIIYHICLNQIKFHTIFFYQKNEELKINYLLIRKDFITVIKTKYLN